MNTFTPELRQLVLEHDPSQWHQQLRSTLWKMLGSASIARDLEQVERLTGLIEQYNLDDSAHGLLTITWRAIMFWLYNPTLNLWAPSRPSLHERSSA